MDGKTITPTKKIGLADLLTPANPFRHTYSAGISNEEEL